MAAVQGHEDAKKYADCMERVRGHIRTIDAIFSGRIRTGYQELNAELIFLHFRKALEEIAFSSLCANKERYSQARAKYAEFWQATNLLKEIGEINPDFYPLPMGVVSEPLQEPNMVSQHFEHVEDGYLTKEEFAFLYRQSSEVLHAKNSYRTGDPTIDARHTIPEWLSRFQKLLRIHYTKLIDHEEIWMVIVPNEGPVQVNVSRLVEPEGT
jgi:hypothetical protein